MTEREEAIHKLYEKFGNPIDLVKYDDYWRLWVKANAQWLPKGFTWKASVKEDFAWMNND